MKLINFSMMAVLAGLVLYTGESLSSYSIASKALAAEGVTLAKNDKAAKGGSGNKVTKGVKQRQITGEKIFKGSTNKVDFEATGIGGERNSPMGSMIDQAKARKEFDLIPIRTQWHDEMKQSVSSLETGRASN